MKILLGKSQVALRKCRGNTRTIKAGQLKQQGALDRLIHHDEGIQVLESIKRFTSIFWEGQKRFAMIRQLGPASLFYSFSCAETKWVHLLWILGQLVDNKEYTDNQIENMNWEEKCRLIQSDPVTCARHFDYQISQFLRSFVFSSVTPLGKISYWRIHEWSRSSDRDVSTASCMSSSGECRLDAYIAPAGLWLGERVARWLAVPTSECSQECFPMVGIHASGISIPLSLLMLLGWKRIWVASLTRRVCQCGSLSMHFTSFQLGPCPVALASQRSDSTRDVRLSRALSSSPHTNATGHGPSWNDEKHYRELIMLFTSWWNEETDLIGNCSSHEEYFLIMKDNIDDQMKQYAICTEDLNQMEEHLTNMKENDENFDLIAPTTQDVECQDEAEGTQDLHSIQWWDIYGRKYYVQRTNKKQTEGY